MKNILTILLLCYPLLLRAANPSFGSFSTDQFAVPGTSVFLKSGVQLTNILVSGFIMSNGVKIAFVTNMNFFGFNMTNNNGLLTIVAPTGGGAATKFDPLLYATNADGQIVVKDGGQGMTNVLVTTTFTVRDNTGVFGTSLTITPIANLIAFAGSGSEFLRYDGGAGNLIVENGNKLEVQGGTFLVTGGVGDPSGARITGSAGTLSIAENNSGAEVLKSDAGSGSILVGNTDLNHTIIRSAVDGIDLTSTAGEAGGRVTASDFEFSVAMVNGGADFLHWFDGSAILALGSSGIVIANTFSSLQSITTNGVKSYATNTVLAAGAVGYTNSGPFAINMNVNVKGTSGSVVYWNRSGTDGTTICGTAIFTNTITTVGSVIPVPVNSGVQILTGVGVTIQAYAQ